MRSRDDDWKIELPAFLTGMMLGWMASFIVICLTHESPNKELIERGYKAYNETTGELEWTNIAPSSSTPDPSTAK